jgi:hypothetical protein
MKTLLKLLKKITRYGPIKFGIKLFHRGPGRPPASGLPAFRNIDFTKPDYTLLKSWAKARALACE